MPFSFNQNKSPEGASTLTWGRSSLIKSQVVCGKPMGYIINSQQLGGSACDDVWKIQSLFTIQFRGGGGGVGWWGLWSSIFKQLWIPTQG